VFHHPWFLWLLPLVFLFAWCLWKGRTRSTLSYSSAAADWQVRPTLRQRMAWVPSALLLTAVTLMILSLARPRVGRDQTIVSSEGIAIELVVDRSGSMQALDFNLDGRPVDRLTAIKNVASRFVLGEDRSNDESLAGRISDLVGLVVFAGYADAVTPLTLDHRFLVEQLKSTSIVTRRQEDGTAIGDAISLAVDKLSTLERERDQAVKSRVVILLTDGENTAGEIAPMEAAELAAAMGIKIYTIGVGTKGRAPIPVGRTRSGQTLVQYELVNIDERMLENIADATGGKYFRATDTDSLESIYAEIDQLEKTKVETQQFVDYRELAVQSARIDNHYLPPLLLVALLMLVARVILMHTLFRRLA
jgi:Ca-activated chloride channel homolog